MCNIQLSKSARLNPRFLNQKTTTSSCQKFASKSTDSKSTNHPWSKQAVNWSYHGLDQQLNYSVLIRGCPVHACVLVKRAFGGWGEWGYRLCVIQWWLRKLRVLDFSYSVLIRGCLVHACVLVKWAFGGWGEWGYRLCVIQWWLRKLRVLDFNIKVGNIVTCLQ